MAQDHSLPQKMRPGGTSPEVAPVSQEHCCTPISLGQRQIRCVKSVFNNGSPWLRIIPAQKMRPGGTSQGRRISRNAWHLDGGERGAEPCARRGSTEPAGRRLGWRAKELTQLSW